MDSVLRKRFEYFDITKNGKISKWELKEMMNSKGKIHTDVGDKLLQILAKKVLVTDLRFCLFI